MLLSFSFFILIKANEKISRSVAIGWIDLVKLFYAHIYFILKSFIIAQTNTMI